MTTLQSSERTTPIMRKSLKINKSEIVKCHEHFLQGKFGWFLKSCIALVSTCLTTTLSAMCVMTFIVCKQDVYRAIL